MSGGLWVVVGRAPLLQRFVNREADVAAVLRRLVPEQDESVRLVALTGLPGVGKTALVVEVAKRSEDRFPGGRLYVDFKGSGEGGRLALADALASCLQVLGVAPETLPSGLPRLVSLFRAKTADRPVLMIVENVAHRAEIEYLLPAAVGSAVLVTSTARMTDLGLSGGDIYRLEPVDIARGMHMLAEMCRQRRLAGAHGVGELVAACGGLPLTLRVSAARLAIRPTLQPADIAREIRDHRRGLEVFDLLGENSLAAEFQGMYDDLPDEAKRLFRVLGELPSAEFTPELAAAASGMGTRAAADAVDLLHEAGLVDALRGGRYALHDLVWRYAAACAVDDRGATDRADPVRLMVEFLLVQAASADRAILGSRRYRCASHQQLLANRADLFQPGDRIAALRWMDRERWNLMLALEAAVERGWNDMAWQLAEAMSALYVELRYLVGWTESARLGAQAALLAGRPDAAVRLRSFSSRAWLGLGEPERAWRELDASLSLYRDERLRDRRLLASVYELLGRYYDHVGQPIEAQARYREAIELFTAEQDSRGVAFVMMFLGQSLHAAGQHDIARQVLVEAIERIKAEGNPRMEGRALTSLAEVIAELETVAAAMPTLDEAIRVLRDGESAFYEMEAQIVRANWADGPLHDYQLAQQSLARALALDTRLGGARRAELIERLERDPDDE